MIKDEDWFFPVMYCILSESEFIAYLLNCSLKNMQRFLTNYVE